MTFMYYYKTKILFLVFVFLFTTINASERNVVLFSSRVQKESSEISIIIFKKQSDTNLLRVLVKVIPKSDSFKNLVQENKTRIMFEKKKMIEVITRRNDIIYPNDYLYEEGSGYFYLIYTFLGLDLEVIKSISVLDSEITNSNKIVII